MFFPVAFAAPVVIEVPAIIKAGTPGDVLTEDPVLPSRKEVVRPVSGSGTIQQSLSEAMPLSVVGTGMPGNVTQFRGLGRAAEDTNVQTLGIPLNPPQGGGMDLSIFPQFMWSGYEFQMGPALGTFDPRGTAGSLTLTPWSAWALGAKPQVRAMEYGSSAGLGQFSVAGTDGKHMAAVLGYSNGKASGPSGSFSTRWEWSDRFALSAHLLATDIDAETPGPLNQYPQAHQRTQRIIPVAQIDAPIGSSGLLKSSVFYDWSSLKYEDPSMSAYPMTDDRIRQFGFENALVLDEWKFGAGVRAVEYVQLTGFAPSEQVFHLQGSRTFEFSGGWIVEPVLRGVGVTRYGMLPEASLGVRQEWDKGAAWFVRAGMSRHFPSFMNRFYSYPGFPGYSGFVGNPTLAPERDWTLTMGTEKKGWRVSETEIDLSLQFYTQLAQDAQVRAPLDAQTDTMINQGRAVIATLMPAVAVRPTGWLDLGASATLATSKLADADLAFPGLPGFLGVFSASVHAPGEGLDGLRAWEARVLGRFSSAFVGSSAGVVLPPYRQLNLDGQVRVVRWMSLAARLENLLDEPIELVPGFPGLGRVFSVMASLQF